VHPGAAEMAVSVWVALAPLAEKLAAHAQGRRNSSPCGARGAADIADYTRFVRSMECDAPCACMQSAEDSTLTIKHGLRLLVSVLSLAGALSTTLVLAVHHVPQAGPLVANSLRAVIGIAAVARLEEMVASAEDNVMRLRWRGEPSRSLQEMSPSFTPLEEHASEPTAPSPLLPTAPAVSAFTPAPILPPYPEVAAEGDGRWLAVPDPERPAAPALMYKTLIHPDPERRWSELFLVAMPSSAIRLVAVPGTAEPSSDNPEAQHLRQRGLIPANRRDQLLAAFNGGFRSEHGQHGMLVDGVLLLPPRPDMCTIAGYVDGTLQIGTYSRLAAQAQKPIWFRQTPRCMVERGALHAGLRDTNSRGWGSSLEGETVVRRSALALSQDGEVLYMALTNFTTARALALGMQAAGGWNVAQLDINQSFPKFLLFPRDAAGIRHATSLFAGFLFEPNEMLDEGAERDFFYVIRRPGNEAVSAVGVLAQRAN
jgi:hypothetical protein